ncbi:hypothetical protein [Trichormus azollae]|uniref:hypothetical protein n=1 Tax=Trichormus azollae TaxID=1164 RepID=UPI00325CAB5F
MEYYTNLGDVILDSFCCSGMTGVGATDLGRKALLSDLSPPAAFIADNLNTPIDAGLYLNAINEILDRAASLEKNFIQPTVEIVVHQSKFHILFGSTA